MICPVLCLPFAVWDLFCESEAQLGQNSCKSTGVAEAKDARRCVSVWISAFNLGELWFACVVFKGEQSRSDGVTDIVWLQIQLTNPSAFPHLTGTPLHTGLFESGLLLTGC